MSLVGKVLGQNLLVTGIGWCKGPSVSALVNFRNSKASEAGGWRTEGCPRAFVLRPGAEEAVTGPRFGPVMPLVSWTPCSLGLGAHFFLSHWPHPRDSAAFPSCFSLCSFLHVCFHLSMLGSQPQWDVILVDGVSGEASHCPLSPLVQLLWPGLWVHPLQPSCHHPELRSVHWRKLYSTAIPPWTCPVSSEGCSHDSFPQDQTVLWARFKETNGRFIGRIFTTMSQETSLKAGLFLTKGSITRVYCFSYSLILAQESLPITTQISALLSQPSTQPLRTGFLLFLLKMAPSLSPFPCALIQQILPSLYRELESISSPLKSVPALWAAVTKERSRSCVREEHLPSSPVGTSLLGRQLRHCKEARLSVRRTPTEKYGGLPLRAPAELPVGVSTDCQSHAGSHGGPSYHPTLPASTCEAFEYPVNPQHCERQWTILFYVPMFSGGFLQNSSWASIASRI